MRIVGGRHRGRPLTAPPGTATRPTSDRAREAVFNVLAHGRLTAPAQPIVGARVLDAFAGTGALGLEALSRGAAEAVFIENGREAFAALRRNVTLLGETTRARILAADALKPPPADRPCSLVFLDPPYGENLAPRALVRLAEAGWIAARAVCVVELGAREDLPALVGFELLDRRTYGRAAVAFLARTA